MNFIVAWLKANPVVSGIAAAVLLNLAIFGIKSCTDRQTKAEVRHEQQLEKKGADEERLKGNEETINAVEKANDAVQHPDSNSIERMRERYDRTRRPVNP